MRLTEAKSILLQFKTLPGSLFLHRTLLEPPLLSAVHSCLAQVVSDPISSHDQQMEIPFFCTLLHNLPLFPPAVFFQFLFCGFLTQFLWLHFLAINLLHLHPFKPHLPSPGCMTVLFIQGWVSCTWVPLPWPCLLCTWQTIKPQPSLHSAYQILQLCTASLL